MSEAIQLSIEASMHTEALSRSNRDNTKTSDRGEWSESKAGSRYVSSVMSLKDAEGFGTLATLLHNFMDLSQKTGAGPNHAAAHQLRATGLDADRLAYLTTKAVLNCTSIFTTKRSRIKKSSLTIRVAEVIHDEWRVFQFADTVKRKALLKKLCKDFDRRAYPKEWRRKTIKMYFDAEQVSWSGWSLGEKTKIGYALLSMFKTATGYIEFSDCGTYVSLTKGFEEHVRDMVKHQVSMFTLYRPMVVVPTPWSSAENLFRGGYKHKHTRTYSIVKGAGKRDRDRLLALDWSRVLPAINAIQATPWRVSKDMLEAEQWAYDVLTASQAQAKNWDGIGKMPCSEEETLPERPWNWAEDEDVKKAHARASFDVRDRRREAKGRRISAVMALAIAEQCKVYPELYFPHNLDSRGRAYPIPAFLNPQGPDYVKALLEFSKGEPVETLDHLRWIAIAGANAYGNDKISLDERVQWVHDNEMMFLQIATDYQHDMRWLDAGEPFQFLRFCFEWLTYKTEGLGYVSHMVCPVDATCSGLQHYAGMLKDELGGKAVNLIPGYTRQDIYGDVAQHVMQQFRDDEEVSPLSADWLAFGIDRKMTKRQVMVVPYNGKFSSCLAYTRVAVAEKIHAGHKPSWDVLDNDAHNEHLTHLAKAIWFGIDAKVKRAKDAMNWLSKIAGNYSKVMNDSGLPIYDRRMSWLTPDGFEVLHFREDEKQQRVETYFEGRVRLSFYAGTGKLSPQDMALAVAPNFVHALDATHLRATIIKGLAVGIRDYAMIHDSFGVHAKFMPRFLNECVKPAFVEMYTDHDVLTEFADKFAKVCEIPDLPQAGTLDLQGILTSEFFFS